MKIESQAFSDGEMIPKKYTCEGENVSPPLQFKDIPSDARSLVLLVEDPDALSVKPWVHWIAFNINPATAGFGEDISAGDFKEGLSTGNGYEGPCPPSGTHRYHFRLYALNSKLELNSDIDRRKLLQEMEGKIIATAVLTGLYEKQSVKHKI